MSENRDPRDGPERRRHSHVSFDPRDDLILAKKNFKIYAGNFKYSMNEEDIRPLFQAYGKVVSVIIPIQKSGIKCGHAYVLMASEEEGRAAIHSLNGREVCGRILRVEEYKPASERPRREEPQDFDGQPRPEDDPRYVPDPRYEY